MKVKIIFSLLIFFFNLFGCSKPYFEGIIIYDINTTYKGSDLRYKDFYERDKFGDKVILYTNREGFVKREFINSKEFGTNSYLYDPESNIQYATFNFTDTIFCYTADDDFTSQSRIGRCGKKASEKLLGYELSCIELISVDTVLGLETSSMYYYSEQHVQIDYTKWSENLDSQQGKAYELSKSHWLKVFADFGNYEYEMTAIEIIAQELDDEVFMIPEGRPVKFSE